MFYVMSRTFYFQEKYSCSSLDIRGHHLFLLSLCKFFKIIRKLSPASNSTLLLLPYYFFLLNYTHQGKKKFFIQIHTWYTYFCKLKVLLVICFWGKLNSNFKIKINLPNYFIFQYILYVLYLLKLLNSLA